MSFFGNLFLSLTSSSCDYSIFHLVLSSRGHLFAIPASVNYSGDIVVILKEEMPIFLFIVLFFITLFFAFLLLLFFFFIRIIIFLFLINFFHFCVWLRLLLILLWSAFRTLSSNTSCGCCLWNLFWFSSFLQLHSLPDFPEILLKSSFPDALDVARFDQAIKLVFFIKIIPCEGQSSLFFCFCADHLLVSIFELFLFMFFGCDLMILLDEQFTRLLFEEPVLKPISVFTNRVVLNRGLVGLLVKSFNLDLALFDLFVDLLKFSENLVFLIL